MSQCHYDDTQQGASLSPLALTKPLSTLALALVVILPSFLKLKPKSKQRPRLRPKLKHLATCQRLCGRR